MKHPCSNFTILVNLALISTILVDLNLAELDRLANFFFFEVELFLLTPEFGELSQTGHTYPNHLCRFVWLPSYAVCPLQSTSG